jgi:pantoate--beta-alanine ligase
LDEILATDPGFTRDYAEIIDDGASSKRAIVAGWVNGVRLIDNMTMGAITKATRA